MPDRKSLWAVLGLAAAIGMGLQLAGPSMIIVRHHEPYIPTKTGSGHMNPALASSLPAAGAPAEERPFWEDAVVPDPGGPPSVTTVVLPPFPDQTPRDYQAEVLALELGGETRKLADSLLLWFGKDPAAATQWLNQTARFEDLGPRLGTFALVMGGRDQMDTALAWVDAIPGEGVRHEARLRLYAQQVRQKKATRETLQQAGFGSEDIALILSGSLND